MKPSDNKKRHVVSYENMSEEVAAAFAAKYPRGFNDYLPDLTTYKKPDGSQFEAVTLDFPDAVYLVKIKIKTDDLDDIERWLEGEEEAEESQVTGASGASHEGDALPDDNISQYGTDEDSSDADL